MKYPFGLFILLSANLFAQEAIELTQREQGFYLLNIKSVLSQKIDLQTDFLHFRRNYSENPIFSQLNILTSYSFSKRVRLLSGLGLLERHISDSKSHIPNEIRAVIGIQLSKSDSIFFYYFRFRQEFRHQDFLPNQTFGFALRSRFDGGLKYRIFKPLQADRGLNGLSLLELFFVPYTDNTNKQFFNQISCTNGLEYRVSKTLTFQVAYMFFLQPNFAQNGLTVVHNFRLGISLILNFRK